MGLKDDIDIDMDIDMDIDGEFTVEGSVYSEVPKAFNQGMVLESHRIPAMTV